MQVAAAAATPPVCASGVQTIESGGLQRRFVVWRPEAASAAPARPILLLFHGYTGSPDSVTDSSQLPQAAVARGWVVVVPLGSGSPPRWELQSLPAPDDIVFVRQLIGDVAAGRCADASRVVAAGFSNGAGFTARLTCEVRLVGSVMVGGANLGPSCDVPDGYPMVIAHGDADTVVPVAGGPVIGGALHARPLDHTIAEWTAKGAAVTTIIEPGWGHSWVPGTNDAVLRMLATFAV